MDVDESLPISAIEHFAYCPRQAALIHVDGVWEANTYTAQGDADHAAIDRATRQVTRDGRTTWTSLPVWHDALGIHGVCDVVEVSPDEVVPVEHKPTLSRWRLTPSEQQLAAQAMCLEQMWGQAIDVGVIFTRRDHRRHEVAITEELRAATRASIAGIRQIIRSGTLPPPVRDRRCEKCSLRPTCLDDEPQQCRNPFEPAAEGEW